MTTTILVLCAFGFFASLVDAVVGGGGLISVPALFVFLPTAPPPLVLGTNKFASTCGASAAVTRYALSRKIVWSVAIPAGIAALLIAPLGARTVTLLDRNMIRPMILVLLVAVAAYTFAKKDLGSVHEPRIAPERSVWVAIAMGAVLGFYEGFFGPGTGSFLVFALVGLFGFDFLAASATGRLVNFAANLSALIYFMSAGLVRYDVALPMAASTVLGGLVGSRLALKHGVRFIRTLFFIAVIAVFMKFAWDTFAGG